MFRKVFVSLQRLSRDYTGFCESGRKLLVIDIKVLSDLAHVKLMPVGGWCDKRLCRMVECKNNSQFRLRNGSIEQVLEYANHGLFISFPGDYTP